MIHGKISSIVLTLASAVTLAACATPWREEASASAVGCAAKDVVISEPHSGTIDNTWRARCSNRVYVCSVAAAADASAPATCRAETPEETAARPVIPAPVAPARAVETVMPQPSPPPRPATPSPSSEFEQRLTILKRAHDQGLITDQEYAAKRKALLDSL